MLLVVLPERTEHVFAIQPGMFVTRPRVNREARSVQCVELHRLAEPEVGSAIVRAQLH